MGDFEPTGVSKYFDLHSIQGMNEYYAYRAEVNIPTIGLFLLVEALSNPTYASVDYKKKTTAANMNIDMCLGDKMFCLVEIFDTLLQVFGWIFWVILSPFLLII